MHLVYVIGVQELALEMIVVLPEFSASVISPLLQRKSCVALVLDWF
jgi:hypothetical protein